MVKMLKYIQQSRRRYINNEKPDFVIWNRKALNKRSISIIKQRLVPDYLDAVNFIALDGKSVLEEEIINVCHIVL